MRKWRDVLIISVVPMFRGPSDTVGHFASVQMGFVESATRMGERFVIFDGHYFWENDNSNSLIVNAEADNNQNSYISIAKWLLQVASSEKITLLVFGRYSAFSFCKKTTSRNI